MIHQYTLVVVLLLTCCSARIFGGVNIIDNPKVCRGNSGSCGNGCSTHNMIVQGFSTIDAKPDQAIINAQISANGATANEAIYKLQLLTQEVIGVLASEGIA